MIECPVITIGLTSYNAEDTILRALESALMQDWPRTEIIIVDDASKDNSVSLIRKKIEDKANVVLHVNETNKGAEAGRNYIIQNATGDFVAFFDDDDESLPARLRLQHEAITSYEGKKGARIVACYASGTRYYPNGHKVELEAIGSKEKVPHGSEVAARLLYFKDTPGFFYGSGTPTCSLMARRDVLMEFNGLDENFRRNGDVELAVRMALKGGHFIGTQEKCFIQYATGGADKHPEIGLAASLQMIDKHRAFLEQEGVYRYARLWQEFRHAHFAGDRTAEINTLFRLLCVAPVRTIRHLLQTGPKRYLHERKMTAG